MKAQKIDVSRETLEKLQAYHQLLLKWQSSINLIAPSTIESAWERHFLDSIQLLKYIPARAESVADLGSGGGFPGLVLAAMRPDLSFLLVESDAKKCEFLKTVSRETGIVNVKIFNERIEDVGKRARVDLITARALAPLYKLMDHMESFGAAEGLFLKGKGYMEEVEKAKKSYEFDHEAFASVTPGDGFVLKVTIKDPVYD